MIITNYPKVQWNQSNYRRFDTWVSQLFCLCQKGSYILPLTKQELWYVVDDILVVIE
jgi:hypothetical protein